MLVNASTRIIVQGLTGRRGSQFARTAMAYGTRIVAGVRPGKGGSTACGVSVYDSVHDAVAATGATASIVFVPAPATTDAVHEALDAALPLIVCPAEGFPVHDMLRIRARLGAASCRSIVLGPNCPGLIVPDQCLLGIMPSTAFTPGRVGMVTRSGTLTYEVAAHLSAAGFGQSACIGVGADPVPGMTLTDGALQLLESDSTDALVVVGEIGGTAEEHLARTLIEHNVDKPVVACIAGRSAPAERRMGHAGAIISGGVGSARSKIDALKQAGVTCVPGPEQLAGALSRRLRPGGG